jgi:hypothetical protein
MVENVPVAGRHQEPVSAIAFICGKTLCGWKGQPASRLGAASAPWVAVVGVVGDIHQSALERPMP